LAEGSVPGAPEEIAEAETTEALSPPDAGAEFSLVPAELRPPEASSYTLPPEAEISPIPDASLAETPRETPPEPPLSIIEAGEPVVSAGPGEAEPAPGEAEPAPGEAEDPGEPAAAPGYTPVFSVPRISRPEKGKYYLQLGAYTRAELVEEALSRIEQYYPLAVQAEDSEAPLYRILLGPVNSGEGGALLQRFKRGGYGDAFIKRDN
jgi:cell division septation protein DedD